MRFRVSSRGFTLIEMLVVMASLALLLAISAPRYIEHIDRARESVLKQNLAGLRDAIDKFYADKGRYPIDLQELVVSRYLRQVPLDPVTDRADSWTIVAPQGQSTGAVVDVHSGSTAIALDGSLYAKW